MEMIGGTCWEQGKQWVEVKHFACNYLVQNAIGELFYLKFVGVIYTQGTWEMGLHSGAFSKHLNVCFSFYVDTTASYDLLILIQWVAVRNLSAVWMGSSFLPWWGCKEDSLLGICKWILSIYHTSPLWEKVRYLGCCSACGQLLDWIFAGEKVSRDDVAQ